MASLVRGRALALLGAVAWLAVAAAPAAARVELTTKPALHPSFRASAADYVSRCVPGTRLRVRVDASGGDRVSVAGRPERSGTFTVKLSRRTGAALSVRVRPHGGGAVRTHHVRCLPEDFPTWTAERRGAPQAQWYVTTPVKAPRGGYVAIFDSNGTPVWWWRAPQTYLPFDAKLLDDGQIAWGHNMDTHFGRRKESEYEERTLDGRLVRFVRTVGSPTDVHDLERLPNGNLLAITYRRREGVDLSPYGGSSHARVWDGEIQELTPAGKRVWRWNSKDHVSPAETGRAWWYDENSPSQPAPAERGYDLLHVNSVAPDGDGLIVSARALNAVFRIDRATGDIDWKLGGSFVAGESLSVLGIPESEPLFGGQHDARVGRDGTITVYDTRTNPGGAPAADRFRIDPIARTATRIEHVTEPDIPQSQWGGSARRLPGGNWVVCWGGTDLVTEQTQAGAVVLALRFTGKEETYRAQPLPPGRVSASALRRAMDRMVSARRRG